MAKKTRTELSTLALNTNLPDNTQELITPTTERAQLTDERESVVNYKDDLGGVPNAGKFLTVAVDGESLTMVDAPTGDVTGTGTQYQLAVWDGTSALTGYAALTYINSILQAPQLRAESSNGTVTINATDASGGTAWLYFQNASVLKAEISYFIQDDFLTIRTYQKDIVFERAVNTPTLTIDGTTGDATFEGAISSGGAATFSGDVKVSQVNPLIFADSTSTNKASGIITSESGTRKWAIGANFGAGDDSFNIYNYSAASRYLTISSGGNVGIGATSPRVQTEIKGLAQATANINDTGNSKGTLQVSDTANAVNAGGTILFAAQNDSGTYTPQAAIKSLLQNGGLQGIGDLAFSTRNATSDTTLTERLRISSGGLIKVNNATSAAQFNILTSLANTTLQLTNTSTSPYGIYIFYSQAMDADSNFFFRGDGSTGARVIIQSNGDLENANNSYGGFSDIKLKENISDATPKLSDLLKVKIRNYNLIKNDRKQIGVIAQELEEIFPSMISESPDIEEREVTDEEGNVTTEKVDLGTVTKSVKYSVFTPMLIKAIQEQQTIIEDLKARIETLEA